MDQETKELDEEIVRKLKEEHGQKLASYESEDGTIFVFKKPTLFVYEEYIGTVTNETDKFATASRKYCRSCLVYPKGANGKPDFERFDEACKGEPAMSTRVAGSISKLAGRDRPDPKLL